MIVKIFIELIIVIIIIMSGITFWISLKRDRFLVKAMQDDKLISKLINKERINAFNASSQRTISIDKFITYPERIKVWEDSDRKTQILLKVIPLFIVSLAIVASVKISLIIVVFNIVIFLLTFLVSIGASGSNNAFNHIMLLTSIIDEWLKNNKEECVRWIGENTRFKKILNTLLSLQ